MKSEELLAHFLTGALGLTLQEFMPSDAGAGPPVPAIPGSSVWVRAAWRTDRGVVRIRGTNDGAQSQRLNMHVLYLEWWIAPDGHHAGWWRSCRKRPGEWTKGYGSEGATATDAVEGLASRPSIADARGAGDSR